MGIRSFVKRGIISALRIAAHPEIVSNKVRFATAKKIPKNYEDPKTPETCPSCGAPISLQTVISADGELARFVCSGIANREEAEKFLAESFAGNKVPAGFESRDPCGWKGRPEDYGKVWR